MKARKVKKLDPQGPLIDNAARLVRVRLRELRSFEPKAVVKGEIKAQHNMRIAAKRLRYLLELTGFCFGEPAERGREGAREAQELLGDIHDCDMMIPRVRERAEELRLEDVSALREHGTKEDNLEAKDVAQAPNRAAYRGLETLAIYLQARRELLSERFAGLWNAQLEDGVGTGSPTPWRPRRQDLKRQRTLARGEANARAGRISRRRIARLMPDQVTDAIASRAPAKLGARGLDDTSLYTNRELSWLDFNERVLALAEDPSVPLLERVKFCGIYTSNLDEFFMVRVAGLHDQVDAGIDAAGPDGLGPSEQIDAIREAVIAHDRRLAECFERSIKPALAEQGIRVISPGSASKSEGRELETRFREQIFPALTPLAVGLGRPFPYISNLSLSLGVMLHDPEQDVDAIARIKVPKELLGRFLVLEDGTTFVPLEEIIADNLGSLFPGMEVTDHSLFRVARDGDFAVSDEADDLLQAVEDELRKRRFGEVVRLEVSSGMSQAFRAQLMKALEIEERQVYDVEGILGLADAHDIANVSGFRELRDRPWTPVTQPRLQDEDEDGADVMGEMRKGDILVHHPYESFSSSVERFVEQAVSDPDVLAIKQTVYRTSDDSPLVPALIRASERGKQAVCMVELKARFDERANIQWARALEEAGVHVVYGLPGLKTHAKAVLVVRREGDGVRNYVHIGTGNYNPTTARIYSDFGLLTVDPQIGADVAEMFNFITGYGRPREYRRVLVAPTTLRPRIIEEIEKTTAAHSDDSPSRIAMKMNALVDAECIQALYRASQAGVKVDLNVRGICCLRPGVPGVSERINVVSVVGRFLEHSRLYCFERKGKQKLYTGSADLMPRNLDNRVELLVPVRDTHLREEVLEVLELCLTDEANAWELRADGRWSRRKPSSDSPRDVQAALMERYALRAGADPV